MQWTEERVAKLKAMWINGVPVDEIRREFHISYETMKAQVYQHGLSDRVVHSSWSEERTEKLKAMWADGISCSLIGKELEITRCAVIGKVHRLGLPGRVEPKRERGGGPIQRIKRRLEAPPPPKPVPDMKDCDIPMEQRKTLLELTSETCKWPVGDPGTEGFFFCGAPSAAERPYCPAHCRRAYDPNRTTASLYRFAMRRAA